MKNNFLSSIATIPLMVAGVVAGTNVANGATLGSRIDFYGFVFGSSNQFDYIDYSTSPLAPSPNVLGNFKVNDATGSFAPVLANPSQLGTIRDVHQGISSGLITQSGPLFDGSDDPSLYVSDFISLTIPNLVDFSFDLKTVDRTVAIDPNSPNPLNPFILSISSILTGTLTDFITNEVQEAVVTFDPNVPSGIPISLLTPDTFLGPIVYNASLEVVSKSVPEPDFNGSLVLLGGLGFSFILSKGKSYTKLNHVGDRS
ncbi:MAG: hypothetical protein F6J90_36575 [Moorea sp. SIOASIH]|uniref:hypothetical protein n=1 Tax=Moorena sp. SIOASIH TaxID=2607817 RepID=UPI0013BE6BD4|nr:hypothetical protein [Moorena sp. SIOASIH]NEO41551.1 hypothetical protein [Moorena sp. SIOASIH]